LEGRWKGDGRLTARHLDQWLPVLMKCRIAKAIQPSLPAIPIAHDHPWGGTGRTASKEACPVPFRYTPGQMFRMSRHVPLPATPVKGCPQAARFSRTTASCRLGVLPHSRTSEGKATQRSRPVQTSSSASQTTTEGRPQASPGLQNIACSR
jgi:hypothetical protein